MNISQISQISASFYGRNNLSKAVAQTTKKAIKVTFSPCEFPIRSVIKGKVQDFEMSAKEVVQAATDRFTHSIPQKGIIVNSNFAKSFQIGNKW